LAFCLLSIAAWFTPERLKDFSNVDGVVALSHDIGYGMEMSGEILKGAVST